MIHRSKNKKQRDGLGNGNNGRPDRSTKYLSLSMSLTTLISHHRLPPLLVSPSSVASPCYCIFSILCFSAPYASIGEPHVISLLIFLNSRIFMLSINYEIKGYLTSGACPEAPINLIPYASIVFDSTQILFVCKFLYNHKLWI